MAISANDIRKGMVILHEGNPVKVMEFHHHTPGNLRAMVQARLRNLLTGNSFEFRFRSNDTLEKITLEQHRMDYLYSDGSHHHFMNSETYEQVALTEDELGDAALKRVGRRVWNRRLSLAIHTLRALTWFDHLYIGGGNSRHVRLKLPSDISVVDNKAGIIGGIRLWAGEKS